ncbi:MAG: 4Fe-4S dicluster domain-containing protein [Bacteroidales bacterium]|nr:4Fe-4S dicluster domain-containing protein [Bacteroidales bacterium]
MSYINEQSRREFLRKLAVGAGGLALLGNYGFIFPCQTPNGEIKAIIVNFDKCAGCRTCETACSAYNNQVEVEGRMMKGLGNPDLSNIKVWHYNPDVDAPVTCFLCEDAPCIDSCPITPDPITGRKALYRDETFNTIKCDLDRCIGCEKCSKACREKSGGVIFPNKETGIPERMCTLCDGDPQCVKYCPYGALQYLTVALEMQLRNMSPDKIAEKLIEKYYRN